ncbi:MAG: hypothetical protein M5U26_16435 [Planctomycetota bacterium]|nr:hypothetical protein [Planctomycetota bacterium]
MSDGGDATPARPDPLLDLAPAAFVERLEPFERVLIELKETLYEGSWDRVLDDLRARLDGRPYLFKLGQTIARDIAAIERMRAYERRHGLELTDWIRKPNSE